ncbi:MAG TPA: DUF3382 domain-containing protein, partial [Geminicoccaceae bacterium]|nr:DUF3382 domain-containing protein [Geminicoccaceae bacterium]
MAGRVIGATAAGAPRIDWQAALKECLAAAFIAFVLFLPLVGMETVRAEGGIGLNFRFDWVAIGVAAVFVGRMLLIGLRNVRPETIGAVTAPMGRLSGLIGPYAQFL